MENDSQHTIDGLSAATSADDVYRVTVDAAARLLNAEVCEVAIVDGDQLTVRASSSIAPDVPGRAYPLQTSIPGGSYSTRRVCLIDDCSKTRSASRFRPTSVGHSNGYRSILCVPLDDRGVLVARAPTAGALSPADREIAKRLVSTAEAALGRIDGTGPQTSWGTLDDDAESRLEAVAQILSHDLKSPLSVAYGSLDLAASTGEAEHFDRAAAALSRIEEFIDSVVLLARTGQHVSSLEPVDLATALEQVHAVLPMADATIEMLDSATIMASEEVLRHLLENVVENSIDHAGPSVTISVGLTNDGFYIEDDGPGIPHEQRERVFERGYSSAAGHNGLGLSIVNQLAEAHGWSIVVTKGSRGGARFEVSGVEFAEA